MTLDTGTRLGQYEIIAAFGAGGMDEVYRARDTKLGREVAIKVLREKLSKDQERVARFEREAKLLASLNQTALEKGRPTCNALTPKGHGRCRAQKPLAGLKHIGDRFEIDGELWRVVEIYDRIICEREPS